MQQIQLAAAAAVQSVLSGHSLTDALDREFRKGLLTDQQRAAVQACGYGTLRHLGFLRFVLDRLVKRKPKNDKVVSILLVALYQLQYSKAAHYAVVDHAVKSVGAIGGRTLKPFANAVLREYLRKRQDLLDTASRDDVARLSYPRWWIDKLRAQLGQQADLVMELGNLHPPMTLRVNRRQLEPVLYVSMLAEQGFGATWISAEAVRLDEPVSVERLPGFADGVVSVQDAGAQISAHLLDLQPGQHVLDACAAPGGKTGHMLELADVHMTALDRDCERLKRVTENLERLGFRAHIQCADATDLASWWDGTPVDRVLLDAPCSASGVVRRHPDVKWLRRPEDIAGFRGQQRGLLDALWQVVAPNGKLLYVTCSIFREENEEQVDWFLSRHADALLETRHDCQRGGLLLPSKEHDGFFHALFEKV
ncbi:MAG: 16S rRNA (cytosine(967)-C(5))-methyltransferase RsmB [Betaproteobacteria bacterium]|nr:MAG: 16S rRNA (cytosine(967)-C(5))-methyltransferase RsmB [Betaproteobacteria bacterium]